MRRDSDTLALRPTTPADFLKARALFSDPSFEGWGGSGFRTDAQLREKYLGARLPDVECFLVEVGEQVVGFTQTYVDGDGAGMDLILLPSDRGQGLGRQVVDLMLARVRADERTHFVVDPAPENQAAVTFWHAVGFRGEGILRYPLLEAAQ